MSQLAQQKDELAIDAVYNQIVDRIEAEGYEVPQQVTDYYKAHRTELNAQYKGVDAQVQQAAEQADKYSEQINAVLPR